MPIPDFVKVRTVLKLPPKASPIRTIQQSPLLKNLISITPAQNQITTNETILREERNLITKDQENEKRQRKLQEQTNCVPTL
jgi:hypothetical protein